MDIMDSFLLVVAVLLYMTSIAAIIFLVMSRKSCKKDLDSVSKEYYDYKSEQSSTKEAETKSNSKQKTASASASASASSSASQRTVGGRLGVSYKMNNNVTQKIMKSAQEIIDVLQKEGCESSSADIIKLAISNIGGMLGEEGPLPCGLTKSVFSDELGEEMRKEGVSDAVIKKVKDLVSIIIDESCGNGNNDMVDVDKMMTILMNVFTSICDVSSSSGNISYDERRVGLSFATTKKDTVTRRILAGAQGILDALNKEGCQSSMAGMKQAIRNFGDTLEDSSLPCGLMKAVIADELGEEMRKEGVSDAVIEKLRDMVNVIIDGSCGKTDAGMVDVGTLINILTNVVESVCDA
jgi:hypothetical protein